jgi:hypothetical protein
MTGIAHVPYLEHRKPGFLYRRRIPGRLLRSTARNAGSLSPSRNTSPGFCLCVSLRTHVPADAKAIASRLTALCDFAFALAMETDMQHLGDTEIRLLEHLARFEVEAHAAARALAAPRSEQAARQAAASQQATQDLLRRALATGDCEIARDPLRAMAAQLGVALDESCDSWRVLAFEATRILLDVSRERERQELGQFETPSPIFISARTTATRLQGTHAPAGTTSTPAAPALVTSAMASAAAAPAAAPLAEITRGAPCAPASAFTPSGKDKTMEFTTHTHTRRTDGSTSGSPSAAHHHCAADAPAMPLQPTPVAATRSAAASDMQKASTSVPTSDPDGAQVYEAAGWTGLDADTARRVEMRPPRLENIDLRVLSEKSRKALEKPRGIALEEAIDLFCELKYAGYGSDFTREQVADPAAGKKWERDSGSKPKFARSFWPEFLGTGAMEQIAKNDLRDALAFLPRIPAKHGKGQAKYLADHGYQELVERIDSEEESDTIANLEALAARTGVTEADREDARRKALQKRLRSETQIKHRRFLLSVGTMCMELQLADKNPFEILSVSNDDKKRMAASEEKRARTVWDDRIYTLFTSPVFQGKIDEPGEPLFWLPLLARLMGLREEEAAQLSPDDFGSDRGIQFLDIKCTDANHIKTEESQRRIPVHPQLLELGLLELVEMRRRQGQSRLFPHMTRGKTKGKFSENFSKTFTYYRQTNGCYWPGLDYHAFRTTFHGDLMNRDKSDEIRCRLMGHEARDEGARSYDQGLGLQVLYERICDVEIDISMIVSPFASALSETQKRAEAKGLSVV